MSDYEQVSAIVFPDRDGAEAGDPRVDQTLAPGLALAEDPGGQLESFGMSRCRMLAEGIVRGSERGLATRHT